MTTATVSVVLLCSATSPILAVLRLGAATADVVANASDSTQAAHFAAQLRPQVVVIDTEFGPTAIETVTFAAPGTAVLAVTWHNDTSRHSAHNVARDSGSDRPATEALAAVRAGANGYLLRPDANTLLAALHAVAAGQDTFSPGVAEAALHSHITDTTTATPTLSTRETEVVALVATGLTSRQIATRLNVASRTVENHVHNALRKLGLPNRASLATYAAAHGLV